MKIKGIHICDCDGAVGHNDDCLRKAWRAALRNNKVVVKPVKQQPQAKTVLADGIFVDGD